MISTFIKTKIIYGDASLFLPERLLYLVENIRARQTHVCQIPFIEAFEFVSGPDALPPHRDNFCDLFRRRRKAVTLMASADIMARSMAGGPNFGLYVAESG